MIEEYLEIYEAEETARYGVLVHSPVMRHVWEHGSFWYFQAVRVPKGMYRVFNANVQPLFNEEHCHDSVFDRVFFWYWGPGAKELIEKKLRHREEYVAKIKQRFEELTVDIESAHSPEQNGQPILSQSQVSPRNCPVVSD